MKTKEQQLFKALCKFKSETCDEGLLEHATPHVLGQLFFNRMQGVAYGTLKAQNLLGKVNREFRNSLKGAYEQNVRKNRSFLACVAYIAGLLRGCRCNVAMLKGALLCGLYPEGYRTSNDIDLLVHPADVTTVGNMLAAAGFRQGNIRNGVFVPASRREIIESKMTRGETVPYIKEMNMPEMKYLEVDINFSLDYKNSEDTSLKAMLENMAPQGIYGVCIPTLCTEDFFLHLCGHLYKEATTLPWVEMHRDMTLYKYMDLYMLLEEMTEQDIRKLFARVRELEMEKICGFAILQTAELFDMEDAWLLEQAGRALAGETDFLHQVIAPKEKKLYRYDTTDITARFFLEERRADLKEVKTI